MPPIPNFDRQKFISSFANATPCPAFKYSTSSKQLARNKYWSFLQQRQKRKKTFYNIGISSATLFTALSVTSTGRSTG